MKKIFITITLIIISIVMLGVQAFASATNCDTELIPSTTTVQQGQKVTVQVKLKNFTNVGDGINTFLGVLNYDKNVFETLSDTDFAASNGWYAPVYNDANGKMETETSSYTKTDVVIMTITFTAKSTATIGTSTIKLTGVEIANNSDYTGADSSVALNISKVSSNNTNETTNTTTTNMTVVKVNEISSQEKDEPINNTQVENVPAKGTKLPQTGEGNIAVYIIGCLALVSGITYYLYRKNRI